MPRPLSSTRVQEERDYPMDDWSAVLTPCGCLCPDRRKINVSPLLAGRRVSVKHTGDSSGWSRRKLPLQIESRR